MSRESVWKQHGYVIASARNLGHDRLKGMQNTKCGHCQHMHEIGSAACKVRMVKHDKENDTFTPYKCNCNATQQLDRKVA